MLLNLGGSYVTIDTTVSSDENDTLELACAFNEITLATQKIIRQVIAYKNQQLCANLSSSESGVLVNELIFWGAQPSKTARKNIDSIVKKADKADMAIWPAIKALIAKFIEFLKGVYKQIRTRLMGIANEAAYTENKNKTVTELVADTDMKDKKIYNVDVAGVISAGTSIEKTYGLLVDKFVEKRTDDDFFDIENKEKLTDWIAAIEEELGAVPSYKEEDGQMRFCCFGITATVGYIVTAADFTKTVGSFRAETDASVLACNKIIASIDRLISKVEKTHIDSSFRGHLRYNGLGGVIAFHMARVCALLEGVIVANDKNVSFLENYFKSKKNNSN